MVKFTDENVNQCQKTRKRTRNPSQHIASIRKRLVQSGKAHHHVKEKNKIIPAKLFIGQILCACRFKCSSKIDIHRQQFIFEAFYALETWSQKTL